MDTFCQHVEAAVHLHAHHAIRQLTQVPAGWQSVRQVLAAQHETQRGTGVCMQGGAFVEGQCKRVEQVVLELANQGAGAQHRVQCQQPGSQGDRRAMGIAPLASVFLQQPHQAGKARACLKGILLAKRIKHQAPVAVVERCAAGRVDASHADDDGQLCHAGSLES